MRLALIAVDLDGTLLGGTSGRYGILPAATEALRGAARLGLRVCIATGRDLPFILELLEREGIRPHAEGWPHVIIAEERTVHHWRNDAFVPDDAWNREVLAAERSSFTTVRQGVIELLQGPLLAIDPEARRVDGEKEEQRGFVEIVFKDAQASRRGEALLREWLRERQLPYVPVRNVAGVAIRHLTVGKGAVLAAVCERFSLQPQQVLAIGDSVNDLSMVDGRMGFKAAAPANAEPEVQEAVRRIGGYVARGRIGDGVAEAVRALVLNAEGEEETRCALPHR